MTSFERSISPSQLTLALVATCSLGACGTSCPYPVFHDPVTVTWQATPSGASVTPVVLRWTATNDPLPERYYEPVSVGKPADSGDTPVSAARRTGAHELTFDMRDLDAYVRAHPRFTVSLDFADTRGFVQCNHPGMADSYFVDVTFDFNATARTATARFGEVHLAAGACSVAAPGARSSGGALALIAIALCARRRRDAR